MNFFEHQQQARQQSDRIIYAFVGLTLLTIVAVNLVVLTLVALQAPLSSGVAAVTHSGSVLDPQFWISQRMTILFTSLATGGLIAITSLVKILSLRNGGSKIARDMGGTLINADVSDPLRRRLYNVVEEIAIASGTPVPQVYVLEQEPAINAFAAGYSTADAAIAVTLGTLEKLNRAELQGVIAHEFSHIINGDMRINIRMLGVMYGIMALSIVGRKLLYGSRLRVSSSRDNGSVIMLIGLALSAIGYTGLFFTRWMKSALSQQREYLADASAVQFTRDPSGIAGALKKIAAYGHASYLKQDAEEISHMLFGAGQKRLSFATHPPLKKRIERIENRYDAREIEQLAARLRQREHRQHVQAKIAEQEETQKIAAQPAQGLFDMDDFFDNIGNPQMERILAAALLTRDIPTTLSHAAHSVEWGAEVLLYALLDEIDWVRKKQMKLVAQRMGDISEQKVNHLYTSNGLIRVEYRLPLLEICLPTLKRRPVQELQKVAHTVELLIEADLKIDTLEYVLLRILQQHLQEAESPSSRPLHGNKKLGDCIKQVSMVLSILATHGHQANGAAGLQQAQKAFRAGMSILGYNMNLIFTDSWQKDLDESLQVLDKLRPMDKGQLIKALIAVVVDDGQIVTVEQEIMRVICALIHVPIPLLQKASSGA